MGKAMQECFLSFVMVMLILFMGSLKTVFYSRANLFPETLYYGIQKNPEKIQPLVSASHLYRTALKLFSYFFTQALATQTPATTEEHVRSVRPTGVTPSSVTSASVHRASVEFTANIVSWT